MNGPVASLVQEVAVVASDLPEDAADRALALIVASACAPPGYGDVIGVAEWILGEAHPIDKHLDALADEFKDHLTQDTDEENA